MNASREAAEKYFKDGLYEEAVFILQQVFYKEEREYGRYSARTLETRTRMAEMYVVQQEYVEALKIFLEVYRRKLKSLSLKHPSAENTRNRIINLFLLHGSLDMMSHVMRNIVKTFRFLIKMTRKKYQNGLHLQALMEGTFISNDMVEFFGDENPFTLEMRCLVAVIYSTCEDYLKPLQIITDVCKRQKRVFGFKDRRVANTLMEKASIFLKIADFDEAVKSYKEAFTILQHALGTHHRKTLICRCSLAEVYYTIGDYGEARSILSQVAKIQKLHKHKELTLTKLQIAILEYAQGNYQDSLSVFRDIFITRRTPNCIRAMIQNTKGTTLGKLGRHREARIVFKDACDAIRLTNLRAETLSSYRNYAVSLSKEGQVVLAERMLLILAANAVLVINPCHSVVVSIENDLAELWFSSGLLNEALRVFIKIWTFQREKIGEYHPATLRAKCQVAKVYKEQGKYAEALRMYNEVLKVMKAHFYSQHLECLDVQNRIAAIYLCRCSFASAFDIYSNIYLILKNNYKNDHPFLIEIEERLRYLFDRIPRRGLINAAIQENMDDLVTLMHNREDVNMRDKNGCVALHFLSSSGTETAIRIMLYLLNKGAIYDAQDMDGYTPEDFAANDEIRLLFLMVRCLFQSVETCDRGMIRWILWRERLIINARDSAGRTPLMRAVAKGYYDIVCELVYQGADLSLGSEDDGNVLHLAAVQEDCLILQLLLGGMGRTYGQSFRTYLDSTDNVLGATPLHCAAKNDIEDCVKTLFCVLANPHIKDALGKRTYDVGSPEMQSFIRDYAFNFYVTESHRRRQVPGRE